jgi:rare lipoprotein A
MRVRGAVAVLFFLAYGCATTTPPSQAPQNLHGMASWYGQEFAGRTTANGEIFDPALLTAAHRTLPFGTVVDVKNVRTGQVVRVRINDRGPFVGNRMIDLSYAAAQQIGLVEPGIGEVDVAIVKIGLGDREPPAPFDIAAVHAPDSPPNIDFPLPAQTSTVPAEVNNVTVVEERGGVEVRKQVSPDGRAIEAVPVAAPVEKPKPGFVVQVGAFSLEVNARQLVEQLDRIGHHAYIERTDLFRVRLGPFSTREQAMRERASLEANGMSAIVTEN